MDGKQMRQKLAKADDAHASFVLARKCGEKMGVRVDVAYACCAMVDVGKEGWFWAVCRVGGCDDAKTARLMAHTFPQLETYNEHVGVWLAMFRAYLGECRKHSETRIEIPDMSRTPVHNKDVAKMLEGILGDLAVPKGREPVLQMLDPNKGLVKGNVVFTCACCANLK